MSYLVPRSSMHSKRYAVLFLFIGISALFHGVLFALLFFAYQYDTVVSNITLRKDMPVIKFAPSGSPAPKGARAAIQTVAGTKPVQSVQQKPKTAASSVSVAQPIIEEKKVEKAEKSKGTRAALLSETAQIKAQKKEKVQKDTKKDLKKKSEKITQVKKSSQSTLPVPSKEVVAEKKVEQPVPKILEKNEIPEKITTTQDHALPVADNLPACMAEGSPEIGDQCAFGIGETIDDPRLAKYYAQLQTAVSDSWKPPMGISDECVCDVLVMLDMQGNPKEIKIVKSSGVLIYDIAARNALQDAKMPKWAYGKSITISFKQ